MNPSLLHQLLAATGYWPILLRLANSILRHSTSETLDREAEKLLTRILRAGPAIVDSLADEPIRDEPARERPPPRGR